ncbi:MAG: glycosyltransferase [Saonia sp.]
MNEIVIYSPGAFKAYGHAFDYSKGLLESFHELGYKVHIYGMDGPLKFPDFVNEIRISSPQGLKKKQTLLQKMSWGMNRLFNSSKSLEGFVEFYFSFKDQPLVLFETFEYFGLSKKVKNFSGNYFCVFHDTNFNFSQTSLLAGIYKYLARIPSRRIVGHSKKSFVHGSQMKANFVSQMGNKYVDQIEEIPYGAPLPIVSSAKDKADSKSQLGLKTDKNYLLSFGTLRSDKEYLPIVEALRKTTNWEWIIAGPEGDYSYEKITEMAKEHHILEKIITFPKFITNSEQKSFFIASDVVINLYKPFIRHESGTAQLARTYVKPVIVSGPPDLTDYVTKKKIGWVTNDGLKVSEVLTVYEELTQHEKDLILSNIKDLAVSNSWASVVKRILSFN